MTEPTEVVTEESPKRGFGVWPVIGLVAVVALALIVGGIFWFSPATPAPRASETLLASAETSSAAAMPASEAERLFARRIYLEQVESGANINRLAEGKIASYDITARKTTSVNSTVSIAAHFRDGSSAPGTIGLLYDKGSWFFFSMEGEKGGSITGYAAGVDVISNDSVKLFPDIPDSDVDWPLANEMVRQQAANQEYLKGIVNGPITRFVLGKPQAGSGTVNIDATVYSSGAGATPEKVRIVLVPGQFQGRSYFFITAMRSLTQ